MKKARAFIGIDIGLKGGISIISEGKVVFKSSMPQLTDKEVDMRMLFKILRSAANRWECSVGFEQLQAIHMVGASQTFGLGFQAGLIEGCVQASGLPYTRFKAVNWQKEMFVGIKPVFKIVKKKQKLDTKAMAWAVCHRLFPKVSFLATKKSSVPHEGIVDATCIAKYMERKGY